MKTVTVYKGNLKCYNDFKSQLKSHLGSLSNRELEKLLELIVEDYTGHDAPRNRKIKQAGTILRQLWRIHLQETGKAVDLIALLEEYSIGDGVME